MQTEAPTPSLYVSTWTRDSGDRIKTVWTVLERGMPACTYTDEATARAIYAQLRERRTVWQDGRRVNPLPVEPPIWDGDAGEFR